MEDENITPEALPDASQLNAPDAQGTVRSETEALTLDELNQALGKNFTDKASALKSFKDTFSFVGKRVEDVKKEVLGEIQNESRIDQLAKELEIERKERFYDRNPQYASLRKVIEKLGSNPADVVQSEEFKEIYTKVSGFDESQKLKTVLESNPRLTSSRDALSKAQELMTTGRNKDEAEALVARAVIDALDLK